MYCNQVSQGNPEVREVFLEAAMPAFEGDGTKAHVTWRRESQVIAGIPKTGEEPKKKTKYGATETGLVYHEQGKTTLSQVRKDVSADATSRLQDAAVEAAMS
jgi:hypothetical protein